MQQPQTPVFNVQARLEATIGNLTVQVAQLGYTVDAQAARIAELEGQLADAIPPAEQPARTKKAA